MYVLPLLTPLSVCSRLTCPFFFQAGVTKSCTIRLDNQIYCIRDDGEWVDCPHGPKVNDLVMHITKRYSA